MKLRFYKSGGNTMPRAKKGHACLNIKIDAALYRKLMEVSEEAGQTKTMVVERALQAILMIMTRNNGFCARQRPGSLFLWER